MLRKNGSAPSSCWQVNGYAPEKGACAPCVQQVNGYAPEYDRVLTDFIHYYARLGTKRYQKELSQPLQLLTNSPGILNGYAPEYVICQGGALFTFADLAIAAAMNSRGNVTVGLENAMTFHHPARQGEHLTAKASVSCDHGKIPFCRVEIFNDNNELLASGTSLGYRKADRFDFDSLM